MQFQSKALKWIKVMLTFLAITTLLSCSFLGLDKKEKDNTSMYLLLLGAFLANTNATSNTCTNTSGFVICIPKGVTFQ